MHTNLKKFRCDSFVYFIERCICVFAIVFLSPSCSHDNKDALEKSTDYYEASAGCLSCNNIEEALKNPTKVKGLIMTVSNKEEYTLLCKSITTFKNLRSLMLFSDYRIGSELLDSLSSAPMLQELFLKGAQKYSLSKLKKLKNLKKLTLVDFGLKVISIDFLNDLNLHHLQIKDNNGYFEMKGRITRNDSLKILELYRYGGKSLNEQVCNLTGLNTLIIDASRVEAIPAELLRNYKLNKIIIRQTPISKNKKAMAYLHTLAGNHCVILTDEDMPPIR